MTSKILYQNHNIITPQIEALEKKLDTLKPLQKIRKAIQYTTKGIDL